MLKQFWNDDEGAVISPELCIVAAVLLIGLIVGISSVRLAIYTEMQDIADAIEAFDFTP